MLSPSDHANASSATRIQLRKGRGDERIAKLNDSPDMPEGEATYCLKAGYVLSYHSFCVSADHAVAGKVRAASCWTYAQADISDP